MSRALVCDQCEASIPLTAKGEHVDGEDAAWLRIETGGFRTGWDVCSRACAVELIEGGELGAIVDAELQTISEIAQMVQSGDE